MSRLVLVPVLVPVLAPALVAACSEYDVSSRPAPDPAPTSPSPPPPPPEAPAPDTGDPPPPGAASAPMYGHSMALLFEIDAATLLSRRIGPFLRPGGDPVDDMIDIAIDLDGVMYGITADALYRVDPATAEVERACGMPFEAAALTFTSDGVLFAGADRRIVTLDPDDCSVDTLVDDAPYAMSGDLVGLPDGYLYWAVVGRQSDELVRVDPESGDLAAIGDVGSVDLFGLGFQSGKLYGFTADGAVLAIPPQTGLGTEILSDGPSWSGATTNPVVW